MGSALQLQDRWWGLSKKGAWERVRRTTNLVISTWGTILLRSPWAHRGPGRPANTSKQGRDTLSYVASPESSG